MLNDRWKQILRQPGALPALPEVLLRLQAGLYELNLDIDDLCQELQRDPALVAEIVKLINCPLFGVVRRVESLKQAVVMLGLRRVRAVILSQSLRQSLAMYQSPGFDLFRWWDRSLLTGVAAAMLCQQSSPDHAEEAYLAGLTVDIGVLILARYQPGYEQTLREVGACGSGEELCRLSQKRIGFDHAQLAADVFEDWKFPAPIVQAVRSHHDSTVLGRANTSFLCKAIVVAAIFTDSIVSRSEDICNRLIEICESRLMIGRAELANFAVAALSRYYALAAPLGYGSLAGVKLPAALAS